MEIGYFEYVFARRWPVMLVVLVGVIVALIRWKRHPKVSALTLTGLVLFQLQSLGFASVYYFLPHLARRGWTYTSIGNLSIVLDVCHDIVFSIAIVLLAVAVFTSRHYKSADSKVVEGIQM